MTRSSEFFQTAMKKEWQEGQQRIIQLSEVSSAIFEIYIKWLYAGCIFNTCTFQVGDDRKCTIPFSLYGLGETLLDREFQNRAIDMLVAINREYGPIGEEEEGRWYPSVNRVTTLYATTPSGTPARRLVVDWYAAHGNAEWIDVTKVKLESPAQAEFLRDVLEMMYRNGGAEGVESKELDEGIPNSYYHPQPADKEMVGGSSGARETDDERI
jgi:hypothetical protein